VTRLECGRGRGEVKLVREPAGEILHSCESSVESCQWISAAPSGLMAVGISLVLPFINTVTYYRRALRASLCYSPAW
jgi:hypothetical protein